MEKRRSKRKIVRLKAERISGNKNHAVFIENLSEEGIYMITAPAKTSMDFTPGTKLELKFQFPSGDTLNLRCKVIWSYKKTPPDGLTNSVGMEIIAPPLKYKEFVKTLQ
jgi:hypothetical protein